MLLTVDIGNSSIKFGIFDRDKLTSKFSIPTKHDQTAGEIADQIGNRLDSSIDAAIICSVVPELDDTLATFIRPIGIEPRFVRSTDNFGLKIAFNVETTGADRLVNSFAAAEKHGKPCAVVSFGTATTIDVVNRDGEYLGGVIAPGMKASSIALSLATSKLPEVKILKPEHVISKTTETAIRSGIVFGQIAMIDGLLKRTIDELADDPKVIATGGFADMIASDIHLIDVVDPDLTLEGLNLLRQTN